MAILPTISEVAVIKVTGEELFAALENGVSKVPKLEGRFPQVSHKMHHRFRERIDRI